MNCINWTVGSELEITQEMRQIAYDNFQTTDDHGMHIIGKARDARARRFTKSRIHGANITCTKVIFMLQNLISAIKP